MKGPTPKEEFKTALQGFAQSLSSTITSNDEWVIKGFIDIFKNIYTLSCDTKLISKVLELHLFPLLLQFARDNGYKIEPATHQNWYPDFSFISENNPGIKFAVDLKTTYRDSKQSTECNGFTLGSHGEYFRDQTSTKNIQYPYSSYAGHFCLGIIYCRNPRCSEETAQQFPLSELENIPATIKDFIFFAEEKWKIASDKGGSGNTANIGSIKNIADIINGNGTFAKAGEEIFNDYWANYGILIVPNGKGKRKKLSSLEELLKYKRLSLTLCNKPSKKR